MIKNLKTRLMVLFTACTLALCGGFAFIPPVTAFAEETVESVESVETPETSEENAEISSEIERPTWLQQVYIHEEDKDHVARITLIDETRVTLEAIYKDNVSGTINGEYKFIKGDVIEIWANGEWFADMQLFSNGTFDYYDEETPVVPETPDNGENTSVEEVQIPEEMKGLVKEYFEKAKNWLANTYAWIIGISGGGLLTLLLSIFWKLISRKIKRSNNLTEDKVDEIATKAVEKAVSKIVGKSLNVDIQSEVSESVKAQLAPMIRNMQVAMESAKNAEVGTAMVMKAQAKSRLISDEETAEIEARAASLLAHAEKFGGLSVPIQIQTELKGEEKTERETVNLVETPNKPKEKKENESYISF